MKKKKNLILALGIFLCLLVIGKICFMSQKESLSVNPVEAALSELEAHEGSYDEQRIVLQNVSRNVLDQMAAELNASYRITEDESYAVLYLDEKMCIRDVYESEDYSKYISQMAPDYYGTICAVEDYQSTDLSGVKDILNLGDTWNTTKGEGTCVAVIDVGVDTDNRYIAGKISDQSFNATTGQTVAEYDLSVIEEESFSHGTSVACVIAGDYDSTTGIGGIAPGTELLIVRVEPDAQGRISSSDVIFGLAYAIEKNVDVINMSFSFEGNSNPFEKYTELAVDSDIICIASAGNNSSGVAEWPSADPNVIGVGAVVNTFSEKIDTSNLSHSVSFGMNLDTGEESVSNYELESYSNYGENVDIVSFGGKLITTAINEKVTSLSGTSASAAMVSAAVALYRAENPNEEFEIVEELLKASSQDLGTSGIDWYYGCGLLDIHALVVEEKGTVTYDFLTDEIDSEKHLFVRGHKLQDVPEPERNGMMFDGWYFDIQLQDEYDNYQSVLYDDLTVYAGWANEDDSAAFSYTVKNDSTAEIQSYSGKRRYITVPAVIDGYKVTSIGSRAFNNNDRLRQIILPETITAINDYAFADCDNLLAAIIPGQTSIIGDYAFANCPRLSEVCFDEKSKLKSIGKFAFAACGSLKGVVLPSGIQEVDGSVFYMDKGLTAINIEDGSALFKADGECLYQLSDEGYTCVYYATGRTGSYTLDGKTTKIQKFAFAYSRLSQVILPDGLLVIDNAAFPYAAILSMTIPDKVTSISEEAFAYCKSLMTLQFGSGVKKIGENAFAECTSLTTVAPIGENCLKEVGKYAFYKCGSLLEISELLSAVNTIGTAAFYDCAAIREVILPNSLTSLGSFAFSGCTSLESMIFEDGTTLSYLDEWTFNGCLALKSIVLPEGLTEIANNCFMLTGLEYIYIPSSVANIGYGVFGSCSNLLRIEVAENSTHYADVDGVLFSYDETGTSMTMLHSYPGGRAGAYTIPDEIRLIADYAFCGAIKLTEINFGSNLEMIGNNAFSYCRIQNLEFNNRLQTIGTGAFYQCGELKNVICDEQLTRIEELAFRDCYRLESIQLNEGITELKREVFENCTSLAQIDLPDSLQTIGVQCFRNCGLTSIEIPKNVVSIGMYAFGDDYNLKEITFAEECVLSRINYGSFAMCGISSLKIPSSIISIGQEAFYKCDNLERVIFEKDSQLAALAAWTFNGATNLSSIVFEENSNLQHIEARAFENMHNLTEVVIGNCINLQEIDNYAFYNCSALAEIQLPENLNSIGRYAFCGCRTMSMIEIPEMVDFIGRYAFASIPDINVYFRSALLPSNLQESWDYGIKGYYLGSGQEYVYGDWTYCLLNDNTIVLKKYTGAEEIVTITELDGHAVSGLAANVLDADSTIRSLTLPGTVLTISGKAFENAIQLTTINVPASVQFIGDYAFAGSGLENICFDDGCQLTSFSANLFSGAKKLKSIMIPSTVFEICPYAFYNSGLEVVTFAENSNVEIIGKYAFAGTPLAGISFPDSLKTVDYHAFEGTENLKNVEFGNASVNLMGYAFYNTGLTDIVIPEGIGYIGEYCFAFNQQMISIEVDENNPYYSSTEGVLFNKSGTRLISCPSGKTGEYHIPEQTVILGIGAFAGSKLTSIDMSLASDLSTIGNKAFYNCEQLKAINIPANIVSLDYYAFAHCTSLKSVNISNQSVMNYIGEGAFYNCLSLETFNMPCNVWEISDEAFYGCSALKGVNFDENCQLAGLYEKSFAFTGLNSFILPESVQEVGEYAFQGASLTDFTFKSDVLEMGYGCFSDCSSLATMTFESADILKNISLRELFDENITGIQTITILDGTNIPEEAFAACTGLISITLPDTISDIGSAAFNDCYNLSEINLDNVKVIGDRAFEDCIQLADIGSTVNVLHFGIKSFYNCEQLAAVDFSSTEIVAASAFYGCSTLSEAIFSERLCSISEYAFANTSSLQRLIIADSGKSDRILENMAFYNSGLTFVSVGEGFALIPESAFQECRELSQVELADSITEIRSHAFCYCPIQNLKLSSSLKTIDTYAFYGCHLDQLELPAGLEYIGDQAFYAEDYYGQTPVKMIFVPLSLVHLGEKVFPYANVFFEADALPSDVNDNWDAAGNITSYFGCLAPREQNGITFVPTKDGNCLVSYSGSASELDLSTIDGRPTYGILADCFHGCTELQSIELGSALCYLGERAFSGCTALTHIGIEETKLSSFPANVLDGCTGLTSVILPETIISIERYAFQNCTSLQTISLSEGITVIGEGAFKKCNQLSNLSLPSSVIEIGDSAFYNCSSLISINLPEGLTSLGGSAFYNCTQLESINLPEGLSSLGSYALYGCRSLTSVEIPAGIDRLYATFQSCTSLKKVVLDGAVEELELTFYGCSSLETIDLPEGLTRLGNGLFKYCYALKSLSLPESLTTIANGALDYCTSLTELIIPAGVKKIYFDSDCAFKGDLNLWIYFKGTELPEGLGDGWDKQIRGYILGYQNNGVDEDNQLHYAIGKDGIYLTGYSGTAEKLVIDSIDGKAVTQIVSNAFEGNTTLQEVTITGTVRTIGKEAFKDCSMLARVTFPDTVDTMGTGVFWGCSALTEVNLSQNLNVLAASTFYGCTSLAEVTLPEGITTIEPSGFSHCCALRNVKFPETLKRIKKNAFEYCSVLTSLDFPDSLEQIEEYAFNRCNNLEQITYPSKMKELHRYAFCSCNKLIENVGSIDYVGPWALGYTAEMSVVQYREGTTVIAGVGGVAKGNSLLEIYLPESVTVLSSNAFALEGGLQHIYGLENVEWIGDQVFSNCVSLENIQLSEKLTHIGTGAFEGCDKITMLTIPDSVEYIGSNALAMQGLETLVTPFVGTDINHPLSLSAMGVPGSISRVSVTGATCLKDTFNGYHQLSSVTLNDEIVSIGDDTFCNCSSLTELILPSNLETIGVGAFRGCSSLTELILPSNLEMIGAGAFSGCSSLTELIIPSKVTSIGRSAFSYCSNLKKLVIPPSVQTLGDSAFYDCNNLEELHIPFLGLSPDDGMWMIKHFTGNIGSFTTQKSLKRLVVNGTNTTQIYGSSMLSFEALETVILSDSITTIDQSAFLGTKVSVLQLPDKLERVGANAFNNTKIRDLYLPDTVTYLDSCAFGGLNLQSLYVDFGGSTLINPFGSTSSKSVVITNPEVNVGTVLSGITGIQNLTLPYIGKTPGTLGSLSELCDTEELETVVLLESCDAVSKDAFDGITGVTIYCYGDASWPEGWNNGNTVYYKDKWREVDFFVDGKVIYTSIQGTGEAMHTPAASLYEKEDDDMYTYHFLGWDLDQDGDVDPFLNTTVRNHTRAEAVYAKTLLSQTRIKSILGNVTESDDVYSTDVSEGNQNIKKITLQISVELLEQCQRKELRIQTDLGKIVLSPDTSAEIVEKATDTVIELSVERLDISDFLSNISADDGMYFVSLTDNGITMSLDSRIGVELFYKIADDQTANAALMSGSYSEINIESVYNEIEQAVYFNIADSGLYRISGETAATETLLFDSNRGGEISAITRAPGHIVQLPECTLDGYCFIGWQTEDGSILDAGSYYLIQTTTELVAVWEEKPTITDLADQITLIPANFVYSGDECIPAVSITGLEENIDYTVEYTGDFINVGTITVTINGIGNYTGQVALNCQITAKDIGEFESLIELSAEVFDFDSTEKEPEVLIQNLEEGKDYVVSYQNNVEIGTATVLIRGIGNYTGEIAKEYQIRGIEHVWDSGTIIIEPTCEKAGKIIYQCVDCDEQRIEEIAATGHNYEVIEHSASCTEKGYIEHICKQCGEKYVSDSVDALGHNYVNGACTRCGNTMVASGYSGYTTWSLNTTGVLTFIGKGAMRNYTGNTAMPWYDYRDQITSVVIEDGVTTIGAFAFYGMTNLTSVTIPESVVTIGTYAFKGCTALDGVVLPAALTTLGESAFYGCTSLTAIEIPASLYTVKPYTFKNCTSLEEVTFHEGNLMKLSDGAFYGTALKEVTFPTCLDIIDVYCFKNCSELASVTIPEGDLTQIREAVFYGTAISELNIPEGVTKVGSYAFKNCSRLTSVSLPGTLTDVGEAAFYSCTGLTSATIPDKVTSIGNYAFRNCIGLTSVTFGKGLKTIGESSFYGDTKLTELNLPAGVTDIGAYAFKSCTGLTNVSLPASLKTIGDSAFYSCTGLTEITIPANVTVIGAYCFSKDSALKTIRFEGNAPAIGTAAFRSVTGNAYYPKGNTTWTDAVKQNYGGNLNWIEQ